MAEAHGMKVGCPKCGYSGPNLIVDKSSDGYGYMTCNNCNNSVQLGKMSSYLEQVLFPRVLDTLDVKVVDNSTEQVISSTVEISTQKEDAAMDVEDIFEVLTKSDLKDDSNFEIIDIQDYTVEGSNDSTLEDTVTNEEVVKITITCPRCQSIETEYVMDTVKLGFVTCHSCGYDSKVEGKRHRIGD